MSDNLEQRLDEFAVRQAPGAGPASTAFLEAIHQRRRERAIRRVFVAGAASLVAAAACITLVVVFGGPTRVAPAPHTVAHGPSEQSPKTSAPSVYMVAHGWVKEEPVNPPAPAPSPVRATEPEGVLSAGSIHARAIAESLL